MNLTSKFWNSPGNSNARDWTYPLFCLLLVAIVFAVYGQVGDHQVLMYDDYEYVSNNTMVLKGLTLDGIYWAFSTNYASNWHPVTWLSHMLDQELFGRNPGAQHLVNVSLHGLNCTLLFGLLRKLTGQPGRSLAVAALLAIHPMHVEPVAWLAERKDVLSMFFCLLTLWSYRRYASRPTVNTYLPVVVFFLLGLMSKPVLVTLPFVLLLLDYWPLQRHIDSTFGASQARPATWRKLVLEKLPLIALSLASCIVTLSAQSSWGSVAPLATHSVGARFANAMTSYLFYLKKLVLPIDLAVIYPYPETTNPALAVTAVLALALLTFMVCRKVSRYPHAFVGWFWFIGTLVPMIGLVQVGYQSMADRYAYFPYIGLYILLVWSVADLLVRHGRLLFFIGVSSAGSLFALTYQQVGHWRNDTTLFEHATEVTDRNYVAYQNLAQAKINEDDLETARVHLLKAFSINPYDAKIHATMGNLHARRGQYRRAIEDFKMALQLNPRIIEVYNNLGAAYYNDGQIEISIRYFQMALERNPDYPLARNNLESALRAYAKQH